MTVRPTSPVSEPVASPPIRVVYRRLGTVEHLDGSEHEVTFHYPRVLVRFLRSLRGAVKVVSIAEVLLEPPTATLAYQPRLTRREMQERLGVSGDEDV